MTRKASPAAEPRVRLRDVTLDDADLLDAWGADPAATGEFNDFGGTPEPIDREALARGPLRNERNGALLVERISDGQPIGTVGWHRAAGGGEQAALGECLLAAVDAADRVPGAEDRLVAILDDARRNDDAHVEVFALDALARIAADTGDLVEAQNLCEVADRRMESASHFITELDRVDARWVRQLA